MEKIEDEHVPELTGYRQRGDATPAGDGEGRARQQHGEYEMVLTNPPFGKKSSVTIVNEAGDEQKQSLVVHRDAF